MTEIDAQYRRWSELMDRKADGESLTPEEQQLCARLGREHPMCARELALLDELSDFDAAPTDGSRALVDATLARMAEEERQAIRTAEQRALSSIRRGARVPRFLWGLGAAAVITLAVVAMLTPPRAPQQVAEPQLPAPSARIELVYAAGDVQVDGKLVPGGTALLSEGNHVTVARGAACLAMDPGIDLCLSEGSELALTRVHSQWRRLDLVRGKAGVQLKPQPEGARLSIVAEGVWSTAVGTAFTVERGEDGAVRTSVLHGRVRVGADGGQEQLIAAHERVEVRGRNVKQSGLARSDESPEWALLSPSDLWQQPVSASLVVQTEAIAAEVLLDGRRVGPSPLSTLLPAGEHRVQLWVDGRVAASREVVMQAGQITWLKLNAADLAPPAAPVAPSEAKPVSGPEPAHTTSAQPTGPSAAEMLSEARRLMRDARFEAAAGQYESLRAAYPDSAEAHTVLVSLAELELDRLGRPERALVGLERYLVQGGPLSEEARHLRIRALRALNQRESERVAIREFLSLYPASFRAAALAQRLDALGQ